MAWLLKSMEHEIVWAGILGGYGVPVPPALHTTCILVGCRFIRFGHVTVATTFRPLWLQRTGHVGPTFRSPLARPHFSVFLEITVSRKLETIGICQRTVNSKARPIYSDYVDTRIRFSNSLQNNNQNLFRHKDQRMRIRGYLKTQNFSIRIEAYERYQSRVLLRWHWCAKPYITETVG